MKETKLARKLSWLVAVIFALLPFHAVFTTWLGATFGHLDIFRIWKELIIAALGLAALYLVQQNGGLRSYFKQHRLAQLVGLYVLLHGTLGLVAVLAHKVTAEALMYSLLVNTRFLIFMLTVQIIATFSPKLKAAWPKLLIIPAALVIAFGLLQVFVLPHDFLTHVGYGDKTIPAIHTVDQKPEYLRIQSTLRGPNPLGLYVVFIGLILIGLKSKAKNWRFMALMGGSLVTLFFSFSRSAWLALVVSAGLLLYLSTTNRKAKQILLAGSALLIVAASLIVIGLRDNNFVQNVVFHTDETSLSQQSSNDQRTQALEGGLRSLWQHPLGTGPGTAGPASFRTDTPRIAENYFIQIGQEVGLVGLGLFVAIQIIVVHQLWQRRGAALSRILLASLAGITLANLISHAWTDDTLALLWWGLAGIALAPAILNKKRKHNEKAQEKAS